MIDGAAGGYPVGGAGSSALVHRQEFNGIFWRGWVLSTRETLL